MKSDDRNLGMDRSISRRDLLLGMGASAACAFIPGRAFADEMLRLGHLLHFALVAAVRAVNTATRATGSSCVNYQ